MLVVVCGLPRSGSTVRYQIATALAERNGGVGLGWDWEAVRAEFARPVEPVRVVKVHEPRAWVEQELNPEFTRYVFSYRDLRDAIASHIQKDGPMEEAVLRDFTASMLAWDRHFRARRHVLVSRYEDALGDLTPEIARIEEFLGLTLDPRERSELAARLSPESQRAYIERLAFGGAYDPATLLHKKHINDGAVGKWRHVLTPEQVHLIDELARGWLGERGYFSHAA